MLRDTGEKITVALSDLTKEVTSQLAAMQNRLFSATQERLKQNTVVAKDEAEAIEAVKNDKFARVKIRKYLKSSVSVTILSQCD